MAETSTKPVHLLKCFCGCSELTKYEIKNITTMNAARILENALAKKLFENFLKLGHKTDRSRALDELDSWTLCKLLKSNADNRTDENVEKLLELCPSYKWENELQEKYNCWTDAPDDFEQFLDALMAENLSNIESHPDYTRFHETLLDKLKKSKMFADEK